MAARGAERAPAFIDPPGYARHRPEETLLYQIVAEHYPGFREARAAEGKPLPRYVEEEFEAYLKCGRLEEGFLRVRCEGCRAEKLVAFSCKRRGFCPSCGGRRMAETAALLVDEILPRKPIRQWVLSLPFPLRFLVATHPKALDWRRGAFGVAMATAIEYRVRTLLTPWRSCTNRTGVRRCETARGDSAPVSGARKTYSCRADRSGRAIREPGYVAVAAIPPGSDFVVGDVDALVLPAPSHD